MKRNIIHIDEELCNGCGDCVPNCHEGALQIIDGKARLISDLMCDGLGACIGHCPLGAITMEEREAEPYNELEVMKHMLPKGKNTVIAHLKHLKEHQEFNYLKQGVAYLIKHGKEFDLDTEAIKNEVHSFKPNNENKNEHQCNAGEHENHSGTCPGSKAMSFAPKLSDNHTQQEDFSALNQWPIQLHLINPKAGYFKKADVLLTADCVPFSMGNFHSKYLQGKNLAIACPKLDNGQEIYINKITNLIDESEINTLSVIIMQVPCCHSLTQMALAGAKQAKRKVPIKQIIVSIQGEVLSEEWL